jgi:hypothetical protein
MAVTCLASIAIFVGGIAALYGLDWYKNNRRRQNRKLAKKLIAKKDYNSTKEEEQQQPIAEQLA